MNIQCQIAKVFEKVFGKDNCKTIVWKPTKKTKKSIKSIRKFLKILDVAYENTKESKLRFV